MIAGPFDSGFIQWTQPNGFTFTARLWGDEFSWRFLTDQGYQIIKDQDGYYYYAQLDEKGEFTPTDKKVSINPPPMVSYQLIRSPSRLAEIDSSRYLFNQQLKQNHQWFMNKMALRDTTLKIGTILVDFTPSVRNPICFENAGIPPLHNTPYEKTDFDNLLFSTEYWYDDGFNDISPDGERLFGSFRDYPNPFNPTTTIRYDLPTNSKVRLIIYDILGRKVTELVTGRVVAGSHSVVWDGKDNFGNPVSSGVYIYRISIVNFNSTQKMVLLR